MMNDWLVLKTVMILTATSHSSIAGMLVTVTVVKTKITTIVTTMLGSACISMFAASALQL